MTFKPFLKTALISTLLLGLMACSSPEPATPAPTVEQLKMQSQMKALAAEVIKLRESRQEMELLKANIAALDTQIAYYEAKLAERAEEPVVEVVAAPRDPDIINLRGNIYVLIREIDSLKEGMKHLRQLNDSLEIQIEQLAVQTNTEVKLEEVVEAAPVTPAPVVKEEPLPQPEPKSVTAVEPPPVQTPMTKAPGYAFNVDYRMAYNDALNQYFNRAYLEAIQEFRILIQREPDGAYADNAQYWIGECYYSLEDFESAITEFNKVFNFAENNKSDHALFKIAMSYQQLGRYQNARQSMENLISSYPDSELIPQARNFLAGGSGR